MEMRVVFKDLPPVTGIEHEALKRHHPRARFVSRVLLESLCSVASKGDSVLMRLQSRGGETAVECIFSRFRERERERERERAR